jgi:hypothetical protein
MGAAHAEWTYDRLWQHGSTFIYKQGGNVKLPDYHPLKPTCGSGGNGRVLAYARHRVFKSTIGGTMA